MSTINSIGGPGSAWADMNAQRAARRESAFSAPEAADGGDGDDLDALQSMLDEMSSPQGMDGAQAGPASQDDPFGDDSGAQAPADAGSTPSTMWFAQMRTSDGDELNLAGFDPGSGGQPGDPFDDLIGQLQAAASGATDAPGGPEAPSGANGGDSAADVLVQADDTSPDSPSAQRLASMVMDQYAQFSNTTSQQSSSWNVSLEA